MPQGRVPVTPPPQVKSIPNVFVIGDLAAHEDLPMLARPALEEGEHIAEAIHSLILDREPSPFVYRDPGIMAAGEWHAEEATERRRLLDLRVQRLVVEGTGAGNAHSNLVAGRQNAVAAGLPVVVTFRCRTGAVLAI